MSRPLREEILEQVSILPQEHQRRVLNFARELAMSVPVGVAGKELLRFAGAIEANQLEVMAQAIEDSCEGIDLNEW
jgi:hypothetical protein